ncbi:MULTISPECIES: hypothetical protein [unclassified Halomonas]|uniref:hypothetical protein n=1 Tax=Halomonas sp. R57-5 TaxID=1610576 RepID=UPI0012FD5A1D|nr:MULTISPECIES: hypothetical protein [unclassified Halomonas]
MPRIVRGVAPLALCEVLIEGWERRSHNQAQHYTVDFPQFSGHASITLQEEKYDAGDDHGEENSAVQH